MRYDLYIEENEDSGEVQVFVYHQGEGAEHEVEPLYFGQGWSAKEAFADIADYKY